MNITTIPTIKDFYRQLDQSFSQAKSQILISTLELSGQYIYETIGSTLITKLNQGCQVDICIDLVGNTLAQIHNHRLLSTPIVSILKSKGAITNYYRSGNPIFHNHAKIYIIDQQTIYLGGSNLSDHFLPWTDTNFKIVLPRPNPNLVHFYEQINQPFQNSFQTIQLDQENTLHCHKQDRVFEQELLKLINSSQRYLRLVTWMLLLSSEISKAIIKANQRGVDVQLVYSQSNFISPLSLINFPGINHLKAHGISVKKSIPRYNHSKLYWNEHQAIIGSTNIDWPEFIVNTEIVLVSTSTKLVKDLNHLFAQF
jgi:phosphatidylserine/phosphatidylglycerophosphate/cardiolipin synthase-like enzyme